jgi:uncharacterized membrane protein YqjE
MTYPQARSGPAPNDDRSTAELVQNLTELVPRLVREELALATTELRRKGKAAVGGAGLFGAAAVVGWFAVGALVATAVIALALVVPAWLAAAIVCLVLLVVAGVLALIGRGRMSGALPPAPELAIESVKDDFATVRRSARR